MQIVPSTFLALVVILAMMIRGPQRSLALFMALTPFGAAAAFNLPAVGGASIGVTDLGAVALFGLVCLMPDGPARIAGTMRAWQPGFWLLLLMVACTFSALFLPRVFAGQTEVFAISRSANSDGIVARQLTPTTGNLTQLFRIMLGGLCFLAMATLLRRQPMPGKVLSAMVVATVVHLVLGWLDVVSAALGLSQLLEPIRTANYAMLTDHRMIGIKRMVGGFPEASGFGFFSLGLFGFWFAYWIGSAKGRLAPWMLAMTTIVLLRSTSSSAYVSAFAFIVTVGLALIFLNLRQTAGRRGLALTFGALLGAWLVFVAVFASYQLIDPVTAYLDRLLFDKLDSSSGVERMSWNAQALVNFADTYGFGAGLGSVRASNWLVACLGSIGVVGTITYIAFLISLARARVPSDMVEHALILRCLKSGCLALVLAAMLTHATPDLGLFFFAISGMVAGLSRGAQLESRRNAAEDYRASGTNTFPKGGIVASKRGEIRVKRA